MLNAGVVNVNVDVEICRKEERNGGEEGFKYQ